MSELKSAADRNIKAIASLERTILETRSTADRLAARITQIAGSGPMILAHLAFMAAWSAVNLGAVPGLTPFDPFPFGLLTTLVSVEVIFLTLFVLLNQNRMTIEADRRTHLNFQIDLLIEREMTMILRILKDLAARQGVQSESAHELEELLEDTNLTEIVEKLDKALPGG